MVNWGLLPLWAHQNMWPLLPLLWQNLFLPTPFLKVLEATIPMWVVLLINKMVVNLLLLLLMVTGSRYRNSYLHYCSCYYSDILGNEWVGECSKRYLTRSLTAQILQYAVCGGVCRNLARK